MEDKLINIMSSYNYAEINKEEFTQKLKDETQGIEDITIRRIIRNEEETRAGFRAETNKKYNKVRLKVDQLILQLIADTRRRNRLGCFKALDNYYKYGESENSSLVTNYRNYYDQLKKIESVAKEFLLEDVKEAPVKAFTPTGVNDLLGTFIEVVTGARDFREKKAGSIIEILTGLRLRHISDFGKPEEKEE
jgi:hypothetical protein